jgi:cytochrome c553
MPLGPAPFRTAALERLARRHGTLLALSLLGCSAAAVDRPDAPQAISAPAPSLPAPGDAVPSQPLARAATPGCRAPDGVSNSPRTIAETVQLINALPKPLTLPCFLQSLARPLQIRATNSTFSAQPAQGARSPRIFIYQAPTLLSVAPAGTGAQLLEFGEQRPSYRSLKAEVLFPVLDQVSESDPFSAVLFNDQLTACAFCHGDESSEQTASGVREFVSESFRPLPENDVPLAQLQSELGICNVSIEPYRCAMLDALLNWGAVTDWDFPLGMATFR